jgi:hypothetical protein
MHEWNLRPTFYRQRGSTDICAGWLSTTNGDIYDHDGVSYVLMPGAQQALKIGSLIQFARPVDFFPTAYIKEGARGKVSHVCSQTGTVSIALEAPHEGLEGNVLAVSPIMDDGVVDALAPCKAPLRLPSGLWALPVAAALVALNNLLVIEPTLSFTPLTEGEWIMGAVFLAIVGLSPSIFHRVSKVFKWTQRQTV